MYRPPSSVSAQHTNFGLKSATATCNYVQNYGFETVGTSSNPVPGWTVTGGITEVGTDTMNPGGNTVTIAPFQGGRQVKSGATGTGSSNKLSQSITLCPGTTTLTLEAWARQYTSSFIQTGCTLNLCIGSTCSSANSLTNGYTAYSVSAGVSGSSVVISAQLSCGSGTSSNSRGYLDFVTVG